MYPQNNVKYLPELWLMVVDPESWIVVVISRNVDEGSVGDTDADIKSVTKHI